MSLGVLAWALAAALVVATAILGASSFRLVSFTSFILAAYVLAVAEIVLLTEALSLVHHVGAPGYAIGEALLLAAAAVTWSLLGRPRPPLPPRLSAAGFRSLARHPVLCFLATAVAIGLVYQACLVVLTPPNTWDSMAYHLARAAEWHQRGAVAYYPSHSESVNATQPNSEILILHTFAFVGRDTLAALPQLVAELACIAAVFGIARRLGFTQVASAFAALLLATLPQVLLQSVTTQNDLLVASFLGCAFYFALGAPRELALTGLAAGLGLGTKASAVIALPLLLLVLWRAHDRRLVLRGLGLATAGFALVGAYGYVLNVVHTGRALGDPYALGPLRRTEQTVSGSVSTAARLTYNFVDLSGYPVPARSTRPVERIAERLFQVAHIPVNPPDSTVLEPPVPSSFTFRVNRQPEETISYFGPLGALLILPLSVRFLARAALGRAPPPLLGFALAVPTFVVGIAVSTKYNEYNGRYLLPAVVLAMPLAACLYGRRNLAAAAVGIGVVTLALVHMQNELKPSGVTDVPAIWSLTRAEAQGIRGIGMTDVIEGVDRYVPENARLGYVLRYNDWIYPFYGPKLSRRLVPLPRGDVLRAANREDVDAVLVAGTVAVVPPSWRSIRFETTGWSVLVRKR